MTAKASTATARPLPPTSLAAIECHEAIITDLVSRARNGDKQAWDALVGRHAPLIWSICRKYEVRGADAENVGQNVWLYLVDHLDRVAIRPHSPAGWPRRPGGNAPGSCAARGPHHVRQVPNAENTSTNRSRRRKRNC